MGDKKPKHGQEKQPTFVERARRRQIVEAAIEVLAEVGSSGTTFVRIAERADISPSLISYHFASKDELFRQVARDIVEDMDAALTAELEGAPSYRDVLRRLIESEVHYVAEHATEMIALGHLHHLSPTGAVAGDLAADRSKSVVELEEMLAEGQRHGEFREFPTRVMAMAILAALESVPGELLGQPAAEVDVHARALADIFDAATRR